jgi:alpha-tubulin suppressor-like RCC1 family protein
MSALRAVDVDLLGNLFLSDQGGCTLRRVDAITNDITIISGKYAIGTNSNSPLTSSPVQVGTASNWTDVAVGNNFTVALNSSGQMFTWGNNSFGQLGNGTSSAVFSPSLIIPNVSWTVVEAGEDYAMAIRSDGMLFAWGKNNNGQLGIGNFLNKQIPTMLESTTPWIGMSCGQAGNNSNQHSLGLKANGTAVSWGVYGFYPACVGASLGRFGGRYYSSSQCC